MAKYFSNKSAIFKITGFLLFAAVLGYTIFALWFLGGRLNKVFGSNNLTPAQVIRFDFEKAKEILGA